MLASAPTEVMAGYAVTAKIKALAPPDEPADVIRARRMAYYKSIAEGPKPSFPPLHRGLLGRGEHDRAQGVRHEWRADQWGDARFG